MPECKEIICSVCHEPILEGFAREGMHYTCANVYAEREDATICDGCGCLVDPNACREAKNDPLAKLCPECFNFGEGNLL
jgi:hypothetical protein